MRTITEEILECIECGVEIKKGIKVDDGVICEECLENHYAVCRDCGKIELRMDMSEYNDGTYICEECVEDEYEICRICGELEKRDCLNYDKYNDNYVCEECFDDKDLSICDECGAIESCDDVYSDGNITLCESCYYDGDYYTCQDCGDIIKSDDTIYIEHEERIICRHCADENYYRCDDCGEYFPQDEVHCDESTVVCNDCYNRDYYTCSHCDDIVHSVDVHFDECGESYCEYCYSELEGDINDYSYKPNPIFHSINENQVHTDCREEENTLYMGIELEVDKGNAITESAKMIQDKLDWCYCKKDGSLDSGFEIVSHPMTLEFMECRKNTFRESFEYLISNSWRSHDTSTCGLHCHVNRKFFGEDRVEQDLNIAKVILIVNLLWEDMVNFSRRKESQLERWCKRNNYISRDITPSKSQDEVVDDCKRQYNRYYAVNLENRNTVEFRLFRGTLNINTFIATMQFVSNICNMAKNIELSNVYNITIKDVINYEEYEELKSYATKRGLID